MRKLTAMHSLCYVCCTDSSLKTPINLLSRTGKMEMLAWWQIAVLLYLVYNLSVVGSMIKDAIHMSWKKSGCTVRRIVLAIVAALPLHAGTIFVAWAYQHYSRINFVWAAREHTMTTYERRV